MHCLGSVVGGQVSPNSVNNGSNTVSSSNNSSNGSNTRGSVLSVIRALGVLVCEGRIQGPPRGYKEGPHCIPPLQLQPNNHICEKDNYLCDRYLVLVREITERVSAVSAYLCVEVVLCCDCPCGLVKSKSKHRVLSSASPLTPWQQSSEMLLEYWSIGLVKSKSPETMNCQGLYQAVRSRLHFSQVAAWWSRTSGKNPSYIATRIVPNPGQPDEHLRRFRETPVEHTFPLAGLGDGNSVKVSVWALPRMEEIPQLQCSMHSTPTDVVEQPETPVKRLIPTNPPANINPITNNNVISPVTPNNSPASQQQQQQQQQQQPTFVYYMSSFRSATPQQQQHQQQQQQQQSQPALLDDRLQIDCDKPGKHHCVCADEDEELEKQGPPVVPASSVVRPNGERKRRRSLPCRPPEPEPPEVQPASLPALRESIPTPPSPPTMITMDTTTTTIDSLERHFRTQLSIDEQQEQLLEKRYKRSDSDQSKTSEPENNHVTHVPSVRSNNKLVYKEHKVNLVVNPMCSDEPAPRKVNTTAVRELNLLMPKLSLSQEKESNVAKPEPQPQGSGILDWISRVPSRVLGAEQQQQQQQQQTAGTTTTANPAKCEVKMRNSCNLELSPREFDEVLAVLRARTPLYRKRSAVRSAKRRYDRLNEPQPQQQVNSSNSNNKSRSQQQQKSVEDTGFCKTVSKNKAADALMGAILRSSSKESNRDEVITEMTNTWTTPRKDHDLESIPATSTDSNVSSSSVSSDSSSSNGDSSLPSALNKRFSRLKQLFKRPEQERFVTPEEHTRGPRLKIIPADSRVKRKIDFSEDVEDNDYAAGDDEEEDDDEETDGSSHFDSSVGTSTNSAYSSISSSSTNGEKRVNGKARLTPEKAASPLTRKSRGKRNLSPIGFKQNHHNNNVIVVNGESPIKPDASAEESESGTEVEQDGGEANDKNVVPSAKDQARFRRSLENAASMVFHSRTGLPLTSSPAPLRRGSCCFDFDSSLNSASSKRSALFELNTPPSPGAVSLEECDREAESAGDTEEVTKRRSSSRHRPQSHALLGSFEESALNGRLEPVSTVHGFTAEIGASGTFCPKHRKLPVTVFFYTLGDNDKVSSPYLAHINLGKKPYQVPRMGTIQVTLLNPLGTVVKMFVVVYDLTDMPPRSHTFLRQRTLRDKTLRYLIHLRFMSGKTGRIYLHTDVRMIICRKADVDTASDFGSEPPKELRSYTHGPTNPKFSPRC